DVLLEALEVALDAALEEAERIARALDRALRLGLDPERHTRLIRTSRLEEHGTGVVRAFDALPRDALIRRLVRDVGGPRLGLAGDVGRPPQGLVVDLLDRLDALHELREVLELRP